MSIADYRPHFSTTEAQNLAHTLYGLNVVASPLPSERDQNFHLDDGSGPGFVLKISSAVEEETVLDLQNKVLTHLNGFDEPLGCPQVCPTLTGEVMTTVSGINNARHFVRLLTYLPGTPLAEVKPQTRELLEDLGHFFGAMDKRLAQFAHPAAHRDLKWDLKRARTVIQSHLNDVADPARRALIEHFLAQFETLAAPALSALRTGIIHNDGNDYNILVNVPNDFSTRKIVGVIDFGDMLHSYLIGEVAIVTTYVMLAKNDPISAAVHVVRGYHQVFPLTEAELAVLYPLIWLRLCTSVTMSAYQQKLEPDNGYLKISEQPAWALLEQCADLNPDLVHYRFRHACGLPPHPEHEAVVTWLKSHSEQFGPVIEPAVTPDNTVVFDLSVGSSMLGALPDPTDTAAFSALLFGRMAQAGASAGVGRYNEARRIYYRPNFSRVQMMGRPPSGARSILAWISFRNPVRPFLLP